MKKKLIITLVAAMTMASFPVTGYAATNNRVTKVITVQSGSALTPSTAPSLVFEASTDHTENFSFELNIENGDWQDTSAFSLPDGVTLTKITDRSMIVNVDVEVFDAVNEDLIIPMMAEELDGIVAVSVDSTGSTITGGTYTIAQAGAGEMTIESDDLESIGRSGTMSTLTFTDYSLESIGVNDRIKIQLNNDFTFDSTGSITGTGKYKDNVQFRIDTSDKSVGYISVGRTTEASTGKIILSGVQIKASDDSSYGEITARITKSGKLVTLGVADYEQLYKDITIDEISTASASPTIYGTAHPNKYIQVSIDDTDIGRVRTSTKGNWEIKSSIEFESGTHTVKAQYYDEKLDALFEATTKEYSTDYTDEKIVFTIGADKYQINKRNYTIDTPAYVDKNNRTMLPVRALSNALGIEDDNIVWDDRERVVTITRADSTTVRIPVDSSIIYIAGQAKIIDTQSVINNDRIFLPLRAVANALGVTDSNISWDADSQTVTINK